MPKAPPTVRLLLLTALLSAPAAASFTTFESGQVRPMALSPDGTRLFAVNTPGDRLEIFSVGAGGLPHEGVGRGDVWVFDPSTLGTSLGGPRLTKVVLFGDTPRALAVSADGNTVYAAVFQSGNQTTALTEGLVCNGGASAGPCTVS